MVRRRRRRCGRRCRAMSARSRSGRRRACRRWGVRVLTQGALLAMVVFLITVVPMLKWFTAVTGPVPLSLLIRMLAAPLTAALAAGLMVASLIARTTARGLGRDDESQA